MVIDPPEGFLRFDLGTPPPTTYGQTSESYSVSSTDPLINVWTTSWSTSSAPDIDLIPSTGWLTVASLSPSLANIFDIARHTITATNSSYTANAFLYVLRPDLVINGQGEDTEESPGVFWPATQNYHPLTIDIQPGVLPNGIVEISGLGLLELFTNDPSGNKVQVNPASWPRSAIPSPLFLKPKLVGTQTATGSTMLTLTYTAPTSEVFTDKVKATVIKVELNHDLWWFNVSVRPIAGSGGYRRYRTLLSE